MGGKPESGDGEHAHHLEVTKEKCEMAIRLMDIPKNNIYFSKILNWNEMITSLKRTKT